MDGWLIGVLGLLAAISGIAVFLLVRLGRQATELGNARARAELLDGRVCEEREAVERLEREINTTRQEREAAECKVAALTVERQARDRQIEEQRALFADAQQRLSDAFEAIGARALRANNAQFLELAHKAFEGVLSEARGDVEKRRVAIEALVHPIRELLEKNHAAVGVLETKREVAYRGLEEQIKGIAVSHERLHGETSRLVSALRRPDQRGRWGEMQLRNAVEMAGLTRWCDFQEQPQTDDPESRDRPDMVVNLPGGGRIVVDSKVALDAYLDALEPGADREALMRRHTEQVARHVRHLAAKKYWEQFDRAPQLVIMFMPLESAFVAALEVRPDLHAEAMKSHVLPATPTLLVALLRAVAYGWQQEAIAANAREIARTGGELYERVVKFVSHLDEVGQRLSQTSAAYNKAVGSLEHRVIPGARRLHELDATSDAEIEPPRKIETELRGLAVTAEVKP